MHRVKYSIIDKMKKTGLKLLGILLFLISITNIVEAVEYRRIGQDYRSLAMGNTGIASANTSAALFYNPAAMANIFTWWFDLPFVQVAYSDDAKSLVEYMQDPSGFSLDTESDRQEFIDEFVGLNPYLKLSSGVNGFMNLSKTGLTIGGNYTYEVTLDIEVRNPNAPEIITFARMDHIRQSGISVPIGLGKFILGAVYKTVERTELDFVYGTNEIISNSNFPNLVEDGISGIGSGYDIGFLYRTATPYHLMIGGVYRKEIELEEATNIPEEYALGMSTQLDFSIFRFVAAVDWRDITNQQGTEGDTSLNRRFHYGIELGMLPIDKSACWLTIRTGYNQGHRSEEYQGISGVELNFRRNMVLGATKYVEETGEFAGQKPSPRTVLYLSFGF